MSKPAKLMWMCDVVLIYDATTGADLATMKVTARKPRGCERPSLRSRLADWGALNGYAVDVSVLRGDA